MISDLIREQNRSCDLAQPALENLTAPHWFCADSLADSLDPWATEAVGHHFDQADASGFGLFFSFDHNHFSSPSEYTEYLKPLLSRPSYFKYAGKPLVSTFNGDSVTDGIWAEFKAAVGEVLLIPGFSAAIPGPDFFATRTALDGVFHWNSWPDASPDKADVSDAEDSAYLSAAHSAGKLFIMGISPLQFKHIDASEDNWYRRGDGNLELILEQTLALKSNMIELQTWKDAGESIIWGIGGRSRLLALQSWTTSGTTIIRDICRFLDLSFKRGSAVIRLPWPRDFGNAEDVVSGIVFVAAGKTDLVAIVSNWDRELGRVDLVERHNKLNIEGLGDGNVSIKVVDGSGAVSAEATGPLAVLSSAALCNYNFQVVGF
ncbi:hypothetical protein PMIN07_001376 [Paraphaeosphaeria minitans]